MSELRVEDLRIGDVCEVVGNVTKKTFFGMITEMPPGMYCLHDISVYKGEPSDHVVWVTQQELNATSANPDRMVLRPQAQYRRWLSESDPLYSFPNDVPIIPTGLSLDELVRYNDGLVVLANCSYVYEPKRVAHFLPPFYDYQNGQIHSQHVTVFELDGDAKLVRNWTGMREEYSHTLPDGATFHKVHEGRVVATGRSLVDINGQTFWLHADRFFAVETAVLAAAGLEGAA